MANQMSKTFNKGLSKELFDQIKLEAKTHSVTYIRIHHELAGENVTEADISRIRDCKDYQEFKEQFNAQNLL